MSDSSEPATPVTDSSDPAATVDPTDVVVPAVATEPDAPAEPPAADAAAEPVVPVPTAAESAWGRVDEAGTVYVRTVEGERTVGSWQAGSPAEALAFYERRYSGFVVEADLLERRIRETDMGLKDAQTAIAKLAESVRGAAAVGDLAGLLVRVEALPELLASRVEEAKAAKAAAADAARATKERIAEEAERIAAGSDWRVGGDRLRALLEEWKACPRVDRKADDALWQRFSTARSAFTKRRKAHYAELEQTRDAARAAKEKLVIEAEELVSSQEWASTASRYRDLMAQWKAAGRANREVDDALWTRFRAAQDTFFAARNGVLAERDVEHRDNLTAKEAILLEAEALLPVTDPRAARAALRAIQERWESAGHVPRDARGRIEARFSAVEDAVRTAEEAQWKRTNPEARARAGAAVAQLRAAIAGYEAQAAKSLAAGNEKKAREATEAAAARREWLVEAEKTLAEFSG